MNLEVPGAPRVIGPVVRLDFAFYNLTVFSRSALPTTLTDDRAIAAAAIIGESRTPNAG